MSPAALVEIDAGITGFAGAHGGYLAALALEAMAPLGRGRPVRSLATHHLAPVDAGPVQIDAAAPREGRSLTVATATLEQEGEAVVLATAAFGAPRASAHARTDAAPPAVPEPEALVPLVERPVPDAGAATTVEHRPAGGSLPLTGGPDAEILVWMRRLVDGAPDAAGLAFLADSGPPALYGALDAYVAMPSAEIVLHFTGAAPVAEDPWVLAVLRNRSAGDGYAVEDGELWTRDGTLLVQSRQLRRVLG